MNDYISRQMAIYMARDDDMVIMVTAKKEDIEFEIVEQTRDAIARRIEELPSADVQPVRQTAEWVYGEKDGADGWYCSKCGFHIPWYYEYYGLNNINFIRDFHTCPHCDSKMMKYTGMNEVT